MVYKIKRKRTCKICGRKNWLRDMTATVERQEVFVICLRCAGVIHSLRDSGQNEKREDVVMSDNQVILGLLDYVKLEDLEACERSQGWRISKLAQLPGQGNSVELLEAFYSEAAKVRDMLETLGEMDLPEDVSFLLNKDCGLIDGLIRASYLLGVYETANTI